MPTSRPIIGIDLGTTNSAVAYFGPEGPKMIEPPADGGRRGATMPSVVGIDGDGGLLIGQAARNQAHLAPERTVASVKRRMGEDVNLAMGTRALTPPEVSALLLGELKRWAEAQLGGPVQQAVISVPAYFTDGQRQATREAGALAGLEVVRILHEPTAAALAYGGAAEDAGLVLVYDFGGGTFDVSIVRVEAGVVEVQVSTGDSHLGGDDIDALMVDRLMAVVRDRDGLEELGPVARARLLRAAEEAKIELSTAPFATCHLDHLGEVDGQPLHFAYTWGRDEFADLIEPLVDRTIALVDRALTDARLQASGLHRVLLVGGSTRIPAVRAHLAKRLACEPEGAVDPDLCVALGAAAQAGMEMGQAPRGVLVDVTPYTFGTSVIGEVDGLPHPRQFVPLIARNTSLPARHSEVFYKMHNAQEQARIEVFQGEKANADDNVCVGLFTFANLDRSPRVHEGGVVFTFSLDRDGMLEVEALERLSGKRVHGRIDNVLGRRSAAEIQVARAHLEAAVGRGPGPLPNEARAHAGEAELPEKTAELLRRTEVRVRDAGKVDKFVGAGAEALKRAWVVHVADLSPAQRDRASVIFSSLASGRP